jgi:hypothetical protein
MREELVSARSIRGRQRSTADLRKAVAVARSRGVSWDQIGGVLNVSGEEAARRYGRRRPGGFSPGWRTIVAPLLAGC